jgi:hypothetical protein
VAILIRKCPEQRDAGGMACRLWEEQRPEERSVPAEAPRDVLEVTPSGAPQAPAAGCTLQRRAAGSGAS